MVQLVQSRFYPGDLVTRTGARLGDSFCIRETPGLCGRVGMYAIIGLQSGGWVPEKNL